MAILGDFRVVDSTGALVSSSFPYSKGFNTYRRQNYDSCILLWVKTGYSSNAHAMSVRVNGTEVGKIFPRPWVEHSILPLESEIFVFSGSVLSSAAGNANTLQIVPAGSGGENYLILGEVLCLFKEGEQT